jgi:hypothetical protein
MTLHITLAAAILTSTLALAASAMAGTYVVDGTCSAWNMFNSQPNLLASYPECPHLRARNIIGGQLNTPSNPFGAGWKFDAPAGTSIRQVQLDAAITGGKSWASRISVHGGPEQNGVELNMANCLNQDQCAVNAGIANVPDFTGSVLARVYCSDSGGCPNGGTAPRASLDINSSKITLFDPSPPAVAIAGGQLVDGGWHGGATQISVNGLDNTGIRAARALIDGDARFSATNSLPCDFSKPVPCSQAQSANVDINLAGLADGQHAVVGQAEDGSGNPATSPAQTVYVDNTPPAAPIGAHLTGGIGWRSGNSFTLAWTNPPESYAPIAGAHYRVCPQSEPDTSSRCTTSSLATVNVDRLAFKVPGPGAWRVQLWLYDAAGNNAPDTGVAIGNLGLLAGRRAPDGGKRAKSRLKVGRRAGRRLKPQTTVELGRTVKVRGRLSTGGRHRGIRRELLVYRRVSVQGAQYELVGRVKTGKRGRFTYRVGAGPSRRLLFVYPGGGRVAGRLATVDVRVRARMPIKVDSRSVRNGQAVTLSGRVRGGTIPPAGALLELQVFSRGTWRPFATPRTDASGNWTFPYRFETVTGTAKFRFRSVLRKQPTYPFVGRSRPVRVRVTGL